MNGFENFRVLIVEDEPIVAMCLEDILDELGCVSIGPASHLAEGLRLAQFEALDAAILDINLGGERSTAIACILRERAVPFSFASGYGMVPEGFAGTPMIEKPYREADIARTLRAMLDPA